MYECMYKYISDSQNCSNTVYIHYLCLVICFITHWNTRYMYVMYVRMLYAVPVLTVVVIVHDLSGKLTWAA